MGNENVREWDRQVGGRIKREKNKRDILRKGAIMGFRRNLVLGKFPGIYKDIPVHRISFSDIPLNI